MADATQVLVVGAGPSGLMTALCLAQNGVSVRIIEKLSQPRVGQKGSGIQPRTLELYKYLGLYEDVAKRARLLQPVAHYKQPGGTEIVREFNMIPTGDATPDKPCPNALQLGQSRHEELIRSHLERYGVQVEFGTELLDFTQDEDKVHVRLAKGDKTNAEIEELDVPFLVGADGGRSKVRKTLGPKFEGETRELDKIVVGDIVVKPPGVALDKWHSWGDPKSKLVMLRPCEAPDEDKVALYVGGPDIDFEKTASSGEEFAKVFYEISGRTDIQFGETLALSTFRPNIRMVDKFGEGRVFIVGDAAHTHSPTGGQGLNSSVQDAANLAWKLALVVKNLAPLNLLQSYSSERVPVIRDMLRRTTQLLNTTMRPGDKDPNEGWQRGGALFQLGINYRWSEIVLDERRARGDEDEDERESAYVGGKGVCAGDRAPDAPVEGPVSRLLDLYKLTRHVALVFSEAGEAITEVEAVASELPAGMCEVAAVLPASSKGSVSTSSLAAVCLLDVEGLARRAYEVTSDPTIVVVRPDGAIGAIVKDAKGVKVYFRRIYT
ncbi:FAD binding domain-containing protein [Schizophyllum commune]